MASQDYTTPPLPPKRNYNFIDRTGYSYGRLKVICQVPNRPGRRTAQWLCLCDCGNEKVVSADGLAQGTQSCGCIKREQTRNMRYRPVRERFWSFVHKDSSRCWLWKGCITKKGYGAFRAGKGHSTLAHVFAYTEFVGPIPEGYEIDHLCRVRHCVNFEEHLEPVTHLENIRRGLQANKTHCKYGHELVGHNVIYKDKDKGHRACRACKNLDATRSRRARGMKTREEENELRRQRGWRARQSP
jgi:HNH endonuclease